MSTLELDHEVVGPWSLPTSRRFWEGFAPSALAAQDAAEELRTRFVAESGWTPVEAVVTQVGGRARVRVVGDGDLESAARQVLRFLSLDVDAAGWPDVALRDPVVAQAQRSLPGLRPCGFHSPYEAATWAVLSQRVRVTQAAALRRDLVAEHGAQGTFPSPHRLAALELDLPGRKPEYLRAVAEAALEGRLDAVTLRSLPTDEALRQVQEIRGIGPFAAELVVVRGANAPDVLPRHEPRLLAEIEHRYGAGADLDATTRPWRPFRSWVSVHLRALRERRLRGTGSSDGTGPT